MNSRRKRAKAADLRDFQLRYEGGFDVDSDEFEILFEALEMYVNALDWVLEDLQQTTEGDTDRK